MFWVMTHDAFPCRTSRAIAAWPAFGFAARRVLSVSNLRRQVSRRASSDAMNSPKSIGRNRSQTPPGLRKSGIPDSVLIPAPVKKTIRREVSMSSRKRMTCGSRTLVIGISRPC